MPGSQVNGSLKLFAISHSCVIDVNQQLYVSLEKLTGAKIELAVPAMWRSGLSPELQEPKVLPEVHFPVHRLPVKSPGNLSTFYFTKGLMQAMRSAKPDIVLIDEEPWSLCAAQAIWCCQRLRLPFVVYTKQNILKRYPPPFRWLEQRTYRAAEVIISLSEEVSDTLKAKGYRKNSPLLAHGCDLALFQPGKAEALRTKLGLHGVVIGYMGRLVPAKGLDSLVDAVGQLVRDHPDLDVSLLLVGAGQEEDQLRLRAASQEIGGRTVFTGAVPHREAGEYLRCMDIFVLPSLTTPMWKEQFGRVIVEALACNVPVVGSDSGQIPYLIRDTKGGLIFPEGDSHALSQALSELASDESKRKEVGELGGAAVRERYTYDAVAEDLDHILHSSLSSK